MIWLTGPCETTPTMPHIADSLKNYLEKKKLN
jgi:hypothetical protein